MICIQAVLLSFVALAFGRVLPPRDGVHLAVSPQCGVTDTVQGLPALSTYKNVVSFGDSFTDAGVHNGGTPAPAVLSPPNPMAGGRISNGPVWVEYLASDIDAKLYPYAITESVSSKQLFPKFNGSDFDTQMNNYLSGHKSLDPSTTLYALFFGVQDFAQTNDTSFAAGVVSGITYNTLVLNSVPTKALNFLLVNAAGLGQDTAIAATYQQQLLAEAQNMHAKLGVNVAVADLNNIWAKVVGGDFAEFGFTSPGACLKSSTSMNGVCSDPETTFEWIPGNPSTATHRIIADYIEDVVSQCS